MANPLANTDASATASSPPPAGGGGTGRLVLKNTLLLTLGQVAGVPLGILMSALMARYLGPSAIGLQYIGVTMCGLGILAVEWGHNGALPALVARDRAASGRLLGTSLLWRACASVFVYLILAATCYLFGYDSTVQIVVALVFASQIFTTVGGAGQCTVLGFERTDVSAYRQILEQVASIVIVAPILFIGGDLYAALAGRILATFVSTAYVWVSLKPAGVTPLAVDKESLRSLTRVGTPFVFFGVAMVLQPYIDAVFLSQLASEEVVGWHAAARRLVGFLVFPATALIGGLYPTLCRLHATDPAQFRATTSGALRAVTLLVFPVALGCGLYPEIGITLYDRGTFGPAEDNLRILAFYLFLVYFTMPLGCAVMAAGKQRQWAVVQSLCVVVSLVLDPLLIPQFQAYSGNGGLGVCAATVVSEIAVLIGALLLTPRGLFDRQFWRSHLLALLAGAAMTATAFALRSWVNPFLAAPLSVLVYCLVLWRTGAIDENQLGLVTGFVRRKLSRRKARAQ